MEHRLSPEGDPLGFIQKYFSGHEPFVTSSGETVQVQKYSIEFKEWDGPPLRETFGGKTVLDVAGKPQFAELAIANLFRQNGFDVRWAETYGRGGKVPKMLLDWQDRPYREQMNHPVEERWVIDSLERIAALNGNSYSGCWDVIAWKDRKIFFVESKRYRRDHLRKSQRFWINAALKSGLSPSNFVVIEWGFAPSIR